MKEKIDRLTVFCNTWAYQAPGYWDDEAFGKFEKWLHDKHNLHVVIIDAASSTEWGVICYRCSPYIMIIPERPEIVATEVEARLKGYMEVIDFLEAERKKVAEPPKEKMIPILTIIQYLLYGSLKFSIKLQTNISDVTRGKLGRMVKRVDDLTDNYRKLLSKGVMEEPKSTFKDNMQKVLGEDYAAIWEAAAPFFAEVPASEELAKCDKINFN